MGVCILGMGSCGSSSSNEAVQNITNLNKVLTTMVNTTTNTTTVQTINVQSANITLGPIKNCGGNIGNIYQSQDSTQTVTVNLDTSSKQDMSTQISNALKAAIKNDTEQKQDVLTTASVESNNYTNVNDYIDNLTSASITTQVFNTLTTLIQNAQTGTVLANSIDCGGKDLTLGNITQNMITSQIVTTIMSALGVQGVVAGTANAADLLTDNEVKQDNSGLGGLIMGIMNTLANLLGGAFLATLLFMAMPCIVLICIVFACCGGMHMLGGDKKPTPSISPVFSTPSVPSGPKIISTPAATAFGKRLKKQLKSLKKF